MQHVIQYQLFDVAYSNAGKSYDLQSKISDIFNNKLTAGMEALFDRLVPEDVLLSLSEVSIDIGSITYSMLDYELADRVLAALEREIRYRLVLGQGKPVEATDEQEQVKSVKANYADLLAHYLLTGTMPWWATGDMLLDPVKVIEQLLSDDAAGLRTLIIQTGQHGYVRQRIVHQFSGAIIRRIITLLEPAEAEFIFDYHETTVKVHSQEKLVQSAPSDEFEKALWLFILTYLLVDRGSLFNQKMFVRSTLEQMSQHYNRQYAELLSLLAVALNSDRLSTKQSGYLPSIIQELFSEEAHARHPEKESYGNNESDGAGQADQNIELIRHYLAFGSLPWWAQPYTIDQLGSLFMDIIKTEPKTLRWIIITTGQNEGVRKRIVTVFGEDVVIAIVKLLEPANAAFIISYVTEIGQLHVKKVIAKADSKDFKRAVWKFVLDFLLVERGSEFNQRMFLQSNIRSLAGNYNIHYLDMLSYFIQSVSQLHQSSIEYAPLFKLLIVLLHEERKDPGTLTGTDMPVLEGEATLVEADAGERPTVLKDLLMHWLRYGNIPWWGKMYFDQSPRSMFQSLLSASADDAMLLIKFAGTDSVMQQRLVYQLPAAFILNVFERFAKGGDGVKLFGYLAEALTTLNPDGPLDGQEVERALLFILWQTLKEEQYQSFNAAGLIQSTLSYFSKKDNISSSQVFDAFKRKLNAVKEKAYVKLLSQALADSATVNTGLLPGGVNEPDLFLLIADYIKVDSEISAEAIKNEAFDTLKYYLANNKLPAQFKGTNPAYVNAVVKQLLEFLNKADGHGLKQLLENAGRADMYQLIETERAVAQIDGGIEQMISAHLKEGTLQKGTSVTEEALQVLAYFLTNNKLPDYLGGVNIQLALKQLLVLLHYGQQSALNSLLQKGGHLASARMQLHNVFAVPANTAESNVSHTLKAYFEQDALVYIKQLTQRAAIADDKLTVLLAPYLSQPQIHQTFIMALLQQSAMGRYVAENYSDDLVFGLLHHHNAVVGGNNNVEWIQQLQRFFNANFTDTLLRDRFNNLLREFNLLVLGGHISAKTPEEYIKALFRFISSVNYALFVQLSGILSAASVTALSTLKLPMIMERLNIQLKVDNAVQQIRQELNKADEQALHKLVDANNEKISLPDDEAAKKNEMQLDSKDTIYINNAGLVILNPFLATYFIRLGMMKEGKFIDTDVKHRAVHLLQYLVDGSEHTPEHALVLNKILCNVPIAEPIPAGILMTDNERQVSEELLKAVTMRWEKMQNTSVPGFQTSFLQRSGALIFKDDAWHLRVEQRGYDVLLQTLPWNIGMIKTPWMDSFLYVEWT
jgi:hypothetical protein